MGIKKPTPNQNIPSGTPVAVEGVTTDEDIDTGNPPTCNDVTCQVDGGNSQSLGFKQHHSGAFTFVHYSGDIGILPDGSHTLTVDTQFDIDTIEDSVTINVGQPPIDAVFTGTCITKSALSNSTSVTIGLRFIAPSTVEITSFPPIVSTAGAFGFTFKSTMSQSGGGNGTFNPGDGSISIPIVFLISVEIDGPLGKITSMSATLATTLTTGPTASLLFSDRGSPLQPAPGSGVVLDGDGTYSSPILGATDGGISLLGTISPHP
jgi:hypothetical protein